jgi:hypothetical protein
MNQSSHVASERLSDYLDGMLRPADVAEIEAHVAECVECGAVVDELRVIIARARHCSSTTPPADLWPVVVATTVAMRSTRRAVLRRSAKGLALLAAGLVIAGVISGMTAERFFQSMRTRPSDSYPIDTSVPRLASIATPASGEDSIAMQYVRETRDQLAVFERAQSSNQRRVRDAADSLSRYERELNSPRIVYGRSRARADWMALESAYRRRLAFASGLARNP